MRPITLTTTDASGGATSSGVAVMDTYQNPFSVTVNVDVTGTVNFTVQYTMDNPFASNFVASSAAWFADVNGSAKTADTEVTISYPVRAIRILQNSGNGSTSTVVIQAGMPGR